MGVECAPKTSALYVPHLRQSVHGEKSGKTPLENFLARLDGRKRHAGSALFNSNGELVGKAHQVWIELKQ